MSYETFFGGYYEKEGTESGLKAISDSERVEKINKALETLRREAESAKKDEETKAGFFAKLWAGVRSFGVKVADVLKDGHVDTMEAFELISDVSEYVKEMSEGTEKEAKTKELKAAKEAIENVWVRTKSGKEFTLNAGLQKAIERKNKENLRAGKESTSKNMFGVSIAALVVGLVAIAAVIAAPFTGFASLVAPFAVAGLIGGGTLTGLGAVGAIGWGTERHNLQKGKEASDKEKGFKKEFGEDERASKISGVEQDLLDGLKKIDASIDSLDKFGEVLAAKEKAAEGKDESSAEVVALNELKKYESKVKLILAAKKDGKSDKTVGEMIAECGKKKRSYWGYKFTTKDHADELQPPQVDTASAVRD